MEAEEPSTMEQSMLDVVSCLDCLLLPLCSSSITFSLRLSAEVDLGPISRQFRPEKYIWLDSPISAWIEHARQPQLILGKVDITIWRHGKRIRPRHPGIPCKNVHGSISWIEVDDWVVFLISPINEIIGVSFEAVRYTFLPVWNDCLFNHQLASEAVVEQTSCGDGVKIATSHCGEVQCSSVGAQSNSVRAEGALADGHGRSVGKWLDGIAPYNWEKACLGVHVVCSIQMPPWSASAKINDNDTITALLAWISDVAYALSWRGDTGAQVEANIVDIAVRVRDIWWEYDSIEDGIVWKVDTDELGPTDTGIYICSIRHCRTAGIQDPKAVERIYDYALDAYEVIFIVGACGGISGVVDCALEWDPDVSIAIPYLGLVSL